MPTPKPTPIRAKHYGGGPEFNEAAWVSMVTAPLENPAVRTPTEAPSTGAVRPFYRTFTVSSTGPQSRFSIVARPRRQGTLMLNMGSVPVWEDDDTLRAAGLVASSDEVETDFVPMQGPMRWVNAVGGEKGIVEMLYDPATKANYWAINQGSGGALSVSLIGFADFVRVDELVEDAWVAGTQINMRTGGASFTTAVGSGVTRGFRILAKAPVQLNATVSAVDVPFNPPIQGCYDLYNTDMLQLGRVSEYRITAMSVLATFTGNQFNDGGQIAAARTRVGWTPTAQRYEALTELQDHSYRGPAKNGAYVWWLPYDYDELRFKTPNDVTEGTNLNIAGIFGDAEGELQVTLAIVAEFYSPLQLFEHEWGPALTDRFNWLYHALDAMPAATCNPKHSHMLKAAVEKAKSTARAGGRAILANPDLFMKALSTLV